MNQTAVAVARDVLQHLSETNALRGLFMSGYVPAAPGAAHLGPLVDDARKECRVCALGACLLSYAHLSNGVSTSGLVSENYTLKSGKTLLGASRKVVYEKLRDVFCKHQLLMIESAFEMRAIDPDITERPWRRGRDDENICGAVWFGYRAFHQHTPGNDAADKSRASPRTRRRAR